MENAIKNKDHNHTIAIINTMTTKTITTDFVEEEDPKLPFQIRLSMKTSSMETTSTIMSTKQYETSRHAHTRVQDKWQSPNIKWRSLTLKRCRVSFSTLLTTSLNEQSVHHVVHCTCNINAVTPVYAHICTCSSPTVMQLVSQDPQQVA